MGAWGLAVWLAVVAAGVLLWVHYCTRLATPFVKLRYRRVNGVDYVGPVLEMVWTTNVALALTLLSLIVFPGAARTFFSSQITSVPSIIVAVGVIGVASAQTLVWNVGEASRIMQHKDEALTLLPADVRARLDDELPRPPDEEALRRALRRLRLNNLPYLAYSVISVALLLILAWILAAGLRGDIGDAVTARSAMQDGQVSPSDSLPELGAQLESVYALFRDYQSVTIDLGVDLTAVLAVIMLLSFWLLGTPYISILAQNVVAIARVAASVVIFVVLPACIIATYLHVAWVSNEVVNSVGDLVDRAHALGPTVDQLTAIHDIEDRILGVAGVDVFWGKLATSSGGLLLLVGAVLSIGQDRKIVGRFLRQIKPFGDAADGSGGGESAREFLGAMLTPSAVILEAEQAAQTPSSHD